MKKITLAITGIFVQLFVVAQTYKIAWGEEIKLKKGTADLDIIAADNTGLYFTEQRRARTMFTIGAPPSSY